MSTALHHFDFSTSSVLGMRVSHNLPVLSGIRAVLDVKLLQKKNTWQWSLTWCFISTTYKKKKNHGVLFTHFLLCVPEANSLDNFYLKISSKKVKSQCRNQFLGLAASTVCSVALGKSLVLSFSVTGRRISIVEGDS